MAYQRNIYKGKKLSQMSTQEVSSAYNELNALGSKRNPQQSDEFFDLKKENTARYNLSIKDTGPGAGAARIEKARAQREEEAAREQPNVTVTPRTQETQQGQQAPEDDVIRLGGARETAKDVYERSLWDKIMYGKLGSTLASDAGTGQSKGAGFEDDVIRLGGTSEALPGESEFQAERRISDQQARARELKYREEDQKFFEDIEIKKRLREVEQRQEDEAFYREIRRKQYERESQERAEEQEDWFEIAREREIRKQKEREADEIYWDKIAKQNRERELREREEDDEYWKKIRKRKDEDKKEPAPQPTPTPSPPEKPGDTIPIKDPETGRTYHVPSSLLFGLLRTSGYYDEFLTEEEKKKKK